MNYIVRRRYHKSITHPPTMSSNENQNTKSIPPKDSFVPPIITTTKTHLSNNSRDFIEITAVIDDILQSSNAKQQRTTTTTAIDDDSVTEDTSVDYSTELEYSIEDDDDDYDGLSTASSLNQSLPNNNDDGDDDNSTRRLLKQAQQRLHHQSIYEEVKLLRTQLHQTLELVNKNNTLEQQLSKANQTIEQYKRNEQRNKEEMAQCEVEFMNKLNEMCEMMEVEIVKRDERIVELEKRLNEKEVIRTVI